MDLTLIVVAGIGLLGSGVVGGIIGARASAAKVLSEAVVNLIKPLNESVEALTKRVNTLSRANRELRRGINILMVQLCENEIPPQWEPPEWLGAETA